MFGVIVRYLLIVLGEALKVAGQSVLKAAVAAAIAALIKGLVDGFRAGVRKANEERSGAAQTA